MLHAQMTDLVRAFNDLEVLAWPAGFLLPASPDAALLRRPDLTIFASCLLSPEGGNTSGFPMLTLRRDRDPRRTAARARPSPPIDLFLLYSSDINNVLLSLSFVAGKGAGGGDALDFLPPRIAPADTVSRRPLVVVAPGT